jgi:hypothetical protein
MKFQSKYSANEYWNDILLHDHEHALDVTPLAGPKFLWDARFPNNVILSDNVVTSWFDLYQNTLMNQYFGEDVTKAPTYETVSGSQTIGYNGINNYLTAYPINEISTSLTILVVATNLQDNLAANSGTILYSFMSNIGDITISYIAENQIGISSGGVQLGVFIAYPAQVIAIRITDGDNGAFAQAWVNGGTAENVAISIGGGLQYLQIGGIPGSYYLDGNVPWVAYYDTALSDVDLNTALSYVGSNFGIPITPVS